MTPEKNLKCDNCDKLFAKKVYLKNHEKRVHSTKSSDHLNVSLPDDIEFNLDKIEKAIEESLFPSLNLNKNKETPLNDSIVSEKIFKCGHCEKVFTKKRYAKNHENRLHKQVNEKNESREEVKDIGKENLYESSENDQFVADMGNRYFPFKETDKSEEKKADIMKEELLDLVDQKRADITAQISSSEDTNLEENIFTDQSVSNYPDHKTNNDISKSNISIKIRESNVMNSTNNTEVEKKFKCEYCEKVFNKKKYARNHEKRIHKQSIDKIELSVEEKDIAEETLQESSEYDQSVTDILNKYFPYKEENKGEEINKDGKLNLEDKIEDSNEDECISVNQYLSKDRNPEGNSETEKVSFTNGKNSETRKDNSTRNILGTSQNSVTESIWESYLYTSNMPQSRLGIGRINEDDFKCKVCGEKFLTKRSLVKHFIHHRTFINENFITNFVDEENEISLKNSCLRKSSVSLKKQRSPKRMIVSGEPTKETPVLDIANKLETCFKDEVMEDYNSTQEDYEVVEGMDTS